MTTVRFFRTKPTPEGESLPVGGTLRFTPTRKRVVEHVEGPAETILPIGFTAQVPSDTGRLDVDLAPTEPGWVWEIYSYGFGVTSTFEYVIVPDQAEPIDEDKLVRVSKDTLDPEREPDPAWWAELESAKALGSQVQQAKTHAVVAASDAGAARDQAQSAQAAAQQAADTIGGSVSGAQQAAQDAAQAKDGAVTAANTATQAATEATQAADTATSVAGIAGNLSDRLTGVEAVAGLAAEAPIDGQTANLIQQPNTLTKEALTAAIVDGTAPVQHLSIAGQVAVSEATHARVTDLHARRQLTPDGRTRTTLITGQPDQTLIISNCTREDDRVRVLEGAQSHRLTCTSAVTMSALVDPVFPPPSPDPYPFGAASIICALVWIDDPSLITTISLVILKPPNPAWSRSHADMPGPLKRGWNLLRWKASAGDTNGWGAAARVTVQVTTKAATSVNIQSVWAESPPKAQILFIEDRGYKTFVDYGLPDLRARGIPVTWALDPMLHGSNVGTAAEAITDAQVAQCYAEGDDMSIHAYAGEVTATMTADQIRMDTLKSHQWLQERGYTRGRQWRAAWTQNNAPNHAAAKPYYAAYATYDGGSSLETWPFVDPYKVARVSLHALTNESMDSLFATLQKTHSLFVCYTHGIHDSLGGAIPHAKWDYLMTKIDEGIAGGWLEGVTFSQLLDRSGGVLR